VKAYKRRAGEELGGQLGYRWRWRGGRGRPMKPRFIGFMPKLIRVIPVTVGPPSRAEPIVMGLDELEALRLVDYEGLTQEQAAERMGVSRGTVWRCLDSARRKVAAMLVEGRELVIAGVQEG